MSEGKTAPPSKLDRALARWPTRERTAREWEQSAERVVDRIRGEEANKLGKRGALTDKSGEPDTISAVSGEDLLRSPLPLTANEVQSSAPREDEARSPGMSTEPREKSRSSFADLAKLAQMTPPPSGRVAAAPSSRQPERAGRDENSGVIDLAALQASGEQSSDAASLSAPSMRVPLSSHTADVARVRDDSPGAAGSDTTADPRRPSAWLALVGVAAVAAAAAGAFFAARHPAATQPDAPAIAVAVTGATPSASPASASKGAAAVAPAPVATGPSDDSVDPSKLPRALPAGAARPGPALAAASSPRAAANAGAGAAGAAANTPAASPPVAPAPAGGGEKNLEALMRESTGAPAESPPVQPAIAPAGAQSPSESGDRSVPLRPSLGAINGAIGTAMPAARACLDVDAPVSRASITFNSDGSVGAVAISGWAAGKPAEECIKAALGKARVPPFAQPTYTVPATIRSN
jgi:hypothetical protein